MGLKSKLLAAAKPAWFVVVMGATITVYSGQAEPFVSPSQLPRGPEFMFGGAAIALVAGWFLIWTLERSSESGEWQAAGRRANLTPEGRGLSARPDLTDTVDGRTVRARTVTRKRRTSGDQGSSQMQRFTVVEADLNRPAEEGLLVAPGGSGKLTAGSASIEIDPEHAADADNQVAVVEDDQLTAVGDSEAAGQAVVSGRSGDSLRAMDGVNLLYVGDASGVVSDYMPDTDSLGSGLGSMVQRKMAEKAEGAFAERVPGDPSTVSAESVGLVLDGDDLRQQAEAVAAVADAFEEAAVRTPSPG